MTGQTNHRPTASREAFLGQPTRASVFDGIELGPRGLSHIDERGAAPMVDVSEKPDTARTACARARVWLPPEVMAALEGNEINGPKGAVVATARIAGIQAAKRTWELIPLCHPLLLGRIDLTHRFEGDELVLDVG